VIEAMLVMAVFLVALSIFSRTMIAASRQRDINRENAIAAEGAKRVFEVMRDQTFEDVFALYNADPLDDPGGVGTAPGNRFDIPELSPVPDSPDGLIGEIVFPVVDVGTPLAPDWQLREDLLDRSLGMPRDLSGDLVIDDLDHQDDYVVLPISVRIAWQGQGGRRETSLQTLLCRYRYGG
jgi:hypothetical protein